MQVKLSKKIVKSNNLFECDKNNYNIWVYIHIVNKLIICKIFNY